MGNRQKSLFAPASKKQEMMFKAVNEAQIVVIGGAAGSGKSYLLQLMPLLFIDDPKTNCIMFRRTTPQITGQGGIWDTGKGIFNSMSKNTRPHIKERALEAIFPIVDKDSGKLRYDGAKVKYSPMEHCKDKFNIQGLQFTFIGVDEACQFEWEQLEYMMSRLRSESKHYSRMVMSCNPDPDHELRKVIDWYLDEEGYPDPEKDGIVRYFIRRDGNFLWGSSKQDLAERYDIPEDKWEGTILSFCFVSANVYDNPHMMESNPEYVAFLEGLNEVDKAQLLHG
jgi:energy-coupling factor transporter ATP-binding protein EcfA2